LDGNGDGFGGDDYLTPTENSFYSLKGDTQSGASGVLNTDRAVSFVDFQRIELNFGKTAASRPAASDGDVNHDGVIDRLDLQIVVANQGHSLVKPSAAAVPSAPVSLPQPVSSPAPDPAPVITPTGTSGTAPKPVAVKPVSKVSVPPVVVTKPVAVAKPAIAAKPQAIAVVKPIVKTVALAPLAPATFSTRRVSTVKDLLK
jgi:hypothetical protein